MDGGAIYAIVLTGAVALVGGGLAWVVRSVVANVREIALLRAKIENSQGSDALREALEARLRLWCREEFVSREDYVPAVSRLEAKLDATNATIQRLEERIP